MTWGQRLPGAVNQPVYSCLRLASGAAFEALGQLIGDEVEPMESPVPGVAPGHAEEGHGAPAEDAPAVALRVGIVEAGDQDGEPAGQLLLVVEFDDAKRLIDVLGGADADSDFRTSALVELINIVSGHFVRSLFDLVGREVRVTAPELRVDMYGSLLQAFVSLAAHMSGATSPGEVGDLAVIAFTARHAGVRGMLLWLPTGKALDDIIRQFKVSS